jgi:hypothetical protein
VRLAKYGISQEFKYVEIRITWRNKHYNIYGVIFDYRWLKKLREVVPRKYV